MSSYYPSFSYKGFNSLKDKKLIVVAFDPDQGEADAFLGMEPIYTEKYDGTKRIDYGAKFNSVAVIKISVMKPNKRDFTVDEVRDFLKWTTGSRQNSYLDLLVGDDIKFSFLGRVTSAYQQKIDSRTIGLTIEFTSVSPWAYSPIKRIKYYPDQSVDVNDNGVLYQPEDKMVFNIDENGVLHNGGLFSVDNNGILYINNSSVIVINNQTDDLYTPIYLNTVVINQNSTRLSIKNITLGEESIISNMAINEVITLNSEQFIVSDSGKIFGDNFNFIWPRLAPGFNEIVISGDGNVNVEFSYRYPMKIGDCAMDIAALNYMCGDYIDDDYFDEDSSSNGNGSSGNSGSSGGTSTSGYVYWNNVLNKPTTLSGYGITDAYTKSQVDTKISDIECDCNGNTDSNIEINEQELNNILKEILK